MRLWGSRIRTIQLHTNYNFAPHFLIMFSKEWIVYSTLNICLTPSIHSLLKVKYAALTANSKSFCLWYVSNLYWFSWLDLMSLVKLGLSEKRTKSEKIFLVVLTNQLIYLVNVKTIRQIFQIMCAFQKVRILKAGSLNWCIKHTFISTRVQSSTIYD